MIVATLIEKLQSMPQHMEVLIDVSRPTDMGFCFTIPDRVDTVKDPAGNEFVYLGSLIEYSNDN